MTNSQVFENYCGLPIFITEGDAEFQLETSENKEVVFSHSELLGLLNSITLQRGEPEIYIPVPLPSHWAEFSHVTNLSTREAGKCSLHVSPVPD